MSEIDLPASIKIYDNLISRTRLYAMPAVTPKADFGPRGSRVRTVPDSDIAGRKDVVPAKSPSGQLTVE